MLTFPMGLSVYSLFKVDILNLVKNETIISRHFHISPIELEQMPYWQYETFNIELNRILKEEKKQQEKLEKQKQEKARKDSLKAALDAANKSNGAQTTKSGSKKLNQSSADNSDRNYPTRKRGN